MSLSDAIGGPPLPPDQTYETSEGLLEVTQYRSRPVTLADAEAWVRESGKDPADYTISARATIYGDGLFSNKMSATPRLGVRARDVAYDLPALYAAARRNPPKRVSAEPNKVGDVAVISDSQIGKVASRGGTPELIERLALIRRELDARWKRIKPERIFLPDVADLVENFESGGNPMRTNDLSLPQQLDVAATEIFEFVRLASKYAPVDVATVPSNHGAWRRGKQVLGTPDDDWGIYVHRQVQKQAQLLGLDATWHFPADKFDESVLVEFYGNRIGIVHGNQFAPGKATEWWARQQHGGQATATADILLTGHYHHLSVNPDGHNPHTKRTKWWLQAPTLDGGSDWYRAKAGDDSDPGLLCFSVDSNGLSLKSLDVL